MGASLRRPPLDALRRTHARAFLRGKHWLILGTLVAIVYILGYLGFRGVDDDTATALYHVLQLFALNSPDVDDPSWMLTAARFLAPAVAAAAAIEALLALFREQLELVGVRFRMQNHVVVVGLGNIGFGVATAFYAKNYRVVVIERDPVNPSIAGCRERGIPVVKGDAADASVLEKTRLEWARHLIVTPGDDGVALDVMAAAAAVVERPRADLRALVHLADLSLWPRLQAEVLASPERFPFAIEFFNVVEAGARALLKKHRPFSDPPADTSRPPHILFVGLEGVGEFAVLHAAGDWHAVRGKSGARLRVSLVGPHVGEQADGLRRRYPELDEICELATDEVAVGDARFQRGQLISLNGEAPVDKAYVCLLDEPAAVSAALALRAQTQLRGVPIIVTVWLQEGGVPSLIRDGSGALAQITEFPVLTRTLPSLLELGMGEVLAELRHEHYIARETARGETPETNPSIAPWDELPASLKQSNRAFASHIGLKLAAKHCALVPAPLSAPDGASRLFSEDEIEELAREEHERWMNDLIRDGWQWTDGEKDPERKLHPRLVPWEELGKADKGRDRDSIRELPAMLARAGFAIQRRRQG